MAMKSGSEARRLFLWPVRRKLMGATLFYLGGVFLAVRFVLPVSFIGVICALLLCMAAQRLARRKGAFLCICALMLLVGNLRAGQELSLFDAPTGTGAYIEGTVCAIEKEHRVVLRDVRVYGDRTLHRNAVVSLLPPKDEEKAMAPTPLVGQQVRGEGRLFSPDVPRNPGATNWRYRALTEGYELSGYLTDGWEASGEARFSLGECFRLARTKLLAHVESLFGPHAALFQGVMLGDKTGLDQQLKQSLQLTGTAHILTVSGLHLSMMAAAVSALLGRTSLGRKSRFALLGVFLGAFTGLTGCAAGTVRAMIMALLRELARVRGRRYEPLTALSCAALMMTLYRPTWALDASFQFSFFVVLGIVLLSGGIARMRNQRAQTLSRARSVARALCSAVGVSLCAQVSALPMQLLLYGYVPLLSLPMNVFCGLLMPVLMLGGWASALIGCFYLPLGRLPASAVSLAAQTLESVSLRAASFSCAIARLPAPFPLTVLLFALLMMLLSSRIRFGRLRRASAAVTAVLVLATYLPRLDPRAAYVQLDVGQGDAALFREDRRAVIVDVGPEDSYDLLRYLRHEGLSVEAVALSHLDQDHAGALGTLLASEIEVPCIVTPKGALEEKPAEAVLSAFALAGEEGILIDEAQRGDQLSSGGLRMLALMPNAGMDGAKEKDGRRESRNRTSLVWQAELEGVSFLLTGDLPEDQEPESLPACDVLKVAHHGSKNATSEALLAQVRPSLALISVGADNWYGHPSPVLLDRLEAAGAQALRTDQCGCITLWLDDGKVDVVRFLPETPAGS